MNDTHTQIIDIPEELMHFPLAHCHLRKRILKELAPHRLLGDLQGQHYSQLFDLTSPNGIRYARTLARQLAALQVDAEARMAELTHYLSSPPKPSKSKQAPIQPQPDALDWLLLDLKLQSIPEHCDDMPVRIIPHDSCINAFLQQKRLSTVGDIKKFNFLKTNWGLGRLKLDALIELMRNAQDERTQKDIANEAEAARLIVSIADDFMKLPDKEDANRMLLLRMCGRGDDDTPWTLNRIGELFGLTRERIRQIIDENQLPGVENFGGMRMHKALLYLADFCEQNTAAITETLFKEWLGDSDHDHSMRFYLALAEALSPIDRLPVWVPTPMVNDGHNQKVVQARKKLKILRIQPEETKTFSEVFSLLKRKMPSICRKTFINALFQSPDFDVNPDERTLTRKANA